MEGGQWSGWRDNLRSIVASVAAVAKCLLCCWLLVVVALRACDLDVVQSSYPTLVDARAAELFGRGWMPDILPESSYAIRVSNNLDFNTSEGSFRFAPADAKAFAGKLQRGSPATGPFSDWDGIVARYRLFGFVDRQYSEDDSTWVFFCRDAAGKCEYIMWLERG